MMTARRYCTVVLSLFAALGGGFPAIAADAADVEFFEIEVRPLLAKRCFECHGAETQKGKVRLDRRASVMGGGEAEPLVIPGNPSESRLMQVLAYDLFDIQMPPKGKLPAEEIAILAKWIERGAVWPKTPEGDPPAAMKTAHSEAAEPHWSFQPMADPIPPAVRQTDRANNAIDQFVLARLEEAGLSYSPRAEKAVLLRRAYFDLIGIPPTPEQMDAFLADDSPDAFATVVERLLASPLYGQRWARHWLDVARYADTKGYVFQENINYPFAYTYRDYVVKAFNSDKPYDRFIVEQLAADLLDLPENAPELAALGFLTVGRRNLNNRPDIIDDRIDVTCRGLMALTVACARCHDHKFDPIPTADYYSLYGVFDSTVEPEAADLPVIGTPERTDAFQQFQAELKKREGAVAAYRAEICKTVEREMRQQSEKYLLALIHGADTFPKARGGAIARWKACLARASESDPIFALWKRLADVPADAFAKAAAKESAALRKLPEFQAGVGLAVLDRLSAKPITSRDELARAYGALIASTANRPENPSPEQTARLDALDARLREMGEPFAISVDAIEGIFNRPERAHIRGLEKKVDALLTTSQAAPPRAMVLRDRETPVQPVIFERGNSSRRGEKVPRRFLKLLSDEERTPFPKDASGRLQLARAIASPENPLTARVLVNRVWQHHFGEGLVRTPSNFGLQGEPPTHPALLDWLAQEFIRRGWSIKELHRLIMASSAYQQSSVDRSHGNSRLAKLDPTNRLLWRMNPRRLEFEAMRDATLAVSGQLDPALKGRPIKLFEKKSSRRTIYGYVNRNDMPGVRRNFDFPSSAATIGERPQTTVPQQALFAMNSPFMIGQARALAGRREIAAAKTSEERVRRLYRIVLQREPRPDESAAAVSFLTAGMPQEQDAKGLSRLAQLAQVMLLTNEFMFIE